jgi:hypothetical protein
MESKLTHVSLCSGKRVGYNNMIYSEHEIERIARVAGELHHCHQKKAKLEGRAFISQACRANTNRAHGWPLLECKNNGVLL